MICICRTVKLAIFTANKDKSNLLNLYETLQLLVRKNYYQHKTNFMRTIT